MPDLVTLSEQKSFMGVTGTTDDALLTALLAQAEALLEAQCHRQQVPFRAGGLLTEHYDGVGGIGIDTSGLSTVATAGWSDAPAQSGQRSTLWLNYPIASLDTVTIGADPATPDETLDVADKTVLRFAPGDRRLIRVDGGLLGADGDPQVVHVSYTSADDLPEDAKLAVKRLVSLVYGQRGSEDVKSEGDGGYTHVLANFATDLPEWAMAVAAHQRTTFR